MKKYFSIILFITVAFLFISPFPALAAKATPQNPITLTYEFWLPNKVGSWKYVESYFKKL